MVRLKAVRSGINPRELMEAINFYREDIQAETAGKTAHDYLVRNRGASAKVTKYLLESIPWGAKS